MVSGVLSVRAIAENCNEGLARASTCGMKRIVGRMSLVDDEDAAVEASGVSEAEELMAPDSTAPVCRRCAEGTEVVVGVAPRSVAARLRVMGPVVLDSAKAASVDEEMGSRDRLSSPLRPDTEGSHPFSPLWMVDATWAAGVMRSPCCGQGESRGVFGVLVSTGEDADRVKGGALLRELVELLLEWECKWFWV